VATLVALLILRTFHLYRSARTARLGPELYAVSQGVIATAAVAALASFFTRGELARSVLALFTLVAWFGLCASRIAIRFVLRELRRRGATCGTCWWWDAASSAAALLRKIAAHRDFGFVVDGLVAADPSTWAGWWRACRWWVPPTSSSHSVERRARSWCTWRSARSEYRRRGGGAAPARPIRPPAVRMVPDLARAFTLNASVEDFDGLPVVLVTETPDLGWNAVMKRGLRPGVLRRLGLVALSPAMLAIAIWVRLDSPGPGALRAGARGALRAGAFRMLKFRTMRGGAESGGCAGVDHARRPAPHPAPARCCGGSRSTSCPSCGTCCSAR
jgi:hypothetical protein